MRIRVPEVSTSIPGLPSALRYQREVVEYLKDKEPELWRWASSAEVRDEVADEMRTQLLKSNYRLDADGHPELTERCQAVAEKLEVKVPVTLYQATGGLGLNAMICHVPGEAHIVFTGPILSTLKGAEIDAVLAHELAHYRFWEMDGGDFMIADRLLMAAANDRRGAGSHAETARRFRLYTEIFADRGSFHGCGQLEAAVATLVKIETGLTEISAAGYLRQADEIFSRENSTAQGVDHPETFIRARALRLWAESDETLDDWLTATIEGPLQIDTLDLVGQRRVARLTRRFLAELLRPSWFQSAAVLAHARSFFSDFVLSSEPDESLLDELKTDDATTREYWSYLLLDFAAIDRELEDLPLARALDLSARLGVAEKFEQVALKELGIGKRQLTKLKKEGKSLLAEAEKRE
jgi:hypothetical protein